MLLSNILRISHSIIGENPVPMFHLQVHLALNPIRWLEENVRRIRLLIALVSLSVFLNLRNTFVWMN